MNPIKVVVTACGCPGASTFIYWLKHKVKERKIYIIGTDMSPEPIGRFICDKFIKLPGADDLNYIESVKSLIEKENLMFSIVYHHLKSQKFQNTKKNWKNQELR